MRAGHHSVVLAAMPDGIGDLTFASPEWVTAAGEALAAAADRHADGLAGLSRFSLCEVAHNAPAYLRAGPSFAWHAHFDGSKVSAHVGELDVETCDLKIEGDHSVMSNLARVSFRGKDPDLVAAAQARLQKLSRWELHGSFPEHPVLGAVLRSLHDAMAPRTMPRFVWMTPEWVGTARHIVTTRAASEEYAHGLKDVVYTFAEEFTDTPRYAFPDGDHGGFWIRCDHGEVTVGAGSLPEALQPADALTKGVYTPVVPVGRTVNATMTDSDKEEQVRYSNTVFRRDEKTGKHPVGQTSPSGRGPMPPELSRVLMPLHDELSKRTSGDLPADYDLDVKPDWGIPQGFDRHPDYDPSWLRYDEVDIYGEPLD